MHSSLSMKTCNHSWLPPLSWLRPAANSHKSFKTVLPADPNHLPQDRIFPFALIVIAFPKRCVNRNRLLAGNILLHKNGSPDAYIFVRAYSVYGINRFRKGLSPALCHVCPRFRHHVFHCIIRALHINMHKKALSPHQTQCYYTLLIFHIKKPDGFSTKHKKNG